MLGLYDLMWKVIREREGGWRVVGRVKGRRWGRVGEGRSGRACRREGRHLWDERAEGQHEKFSDIHLLLLSPGANSFFDATSAPRKGNAPTINTTRLAK